mmetsp:Transcript_42924/g.69175  ORF Transcript_42924/g.69175 Transcript_42924/m.69175 type:complete len:90 (+) Transcript_42924:103-372(+)
MLAWKPSLDCQAVCQCALHRLCASNGKLASGRKHMDGLLFVFCPLLRAIRFQNHHHKRLDVLGMCVLLGVCVQMHVQECTSASRESNAQ